MTYGRRLAEALQLANKERKELARHLDVSVQAIGQVINGTGALTAFNNAHAARYLRVDPHWLATGDGEPRPPREFSEVARRLATAFDAKVPGPLIEATAAQVMGAIMFAEQALKARPPIPTPSAQPPPDPRKLPGESL